MSRFNIGDRVECNLTSGELCNVKGVIVGYAQIQYWVPGQIYDVPSWKIKTDDGKIVSLNERFLNAERKERNA